MVEFIRDVVVVLALLMSLFALAYHAPGEIENARNPTRQQRARSHRKDQRARPRLR